MNIPVSSIDDQSLITGKLFRDWNVNKSGSIDEGELREALGRMSLSLELANQGFAAAKPAATIVARLAGELHELRRSVPPQVWRSLIPFAQQHAITHYLFQDPLTHWSFTKPRGYSGDAGLLDLYYKHPSAAHLLNDCTELGREIYAYTSEVPACAGGRERREILARHVDEAAAAVGGAEILAVAAGHLRESELTQNLATGKISRWVALDQDPVSVGVVTRDYGTSVIEPMIGSVLGLLRRSYRLGTFDLIYISGLYDYLEQKTGIKLMQRLWEMLRPGGVMLFANFSDEMTSDGYMETFMDWPLILRSDKDMWAIINGSIDRNEVDPSVWYGTNRNVVYGTLRRK